MQVWKWDSESSTLCRFVHSYLNKASGSLFHGSLALSGCGAEQVTAPLSVARTKLAKSRHKLASHIFCNMTLFCIYFFDPLFRIFHPPLVFVLVPNPFTSEAGKNSETGIKIQCKKKMIPDTKSRTFFVQISHSRLFYVSKTAIKI